MLVGIVETDYQQNTWLSKLSCQVAIWRTLRFFSFFDHRGCIRHGFTRLI